MSANIRERVLYIDYLKGFAILLVVLGHTIQFLNCPENYDNNLLFRYIYSFHMPLFMMLSGLVTPMRYDNILEIRHKISKRFVQLVIPFIAWSILDCLCIGSHDVFRVFRHPEYGLWFLWILFLINLIFIVGLWIQKEIKQTNVYISICIIYLILRLVRFIFNSDYGIDLVITYFPYFSIGAIVGYLKPNITPPNQQFLSKITIILIFFFMISAYFWYRMLPANMEGWLVTINKSSIYRITVALSGCFSFLLLFSLGSNKTLILQKVKLNQLGMITLPIYAIHQTVIRRMIMPYLSNHTRAHLETWYGLFTSFIIVLIITYIIYYLINKNKYLRMVLLGNI